LPLQPRHRGQRIHTLPLDRKLYLGIRDHVYPPARTGILPNCRRRGGRNLTQRGKDAKARLLDCSYSARRQGAGSRRPGAVSCTPTAMPHDLEELSATLPVSRRRPGRVLAVRVLQSKLAWLDGVLRWEE